MAWRLRFYSFTGSGGDGRAPIAGLVQASDGNLYGTTYYGGTNNNYGVVFRITTNGVETVVTSSFNGADDGADPDNRFGAGLERKSIRNNRRWRYQQRRHGFRVNNSTRSHSLKHSVKRSGFGLELEMTPASVFSLQSAPDLASVFTNIPGATNPYTNTITASQQFFRLADP